MTRQVDLRSAAVEVRKDVHPAGLSPVVVERGREAVEEDEGSGEGLSLLLHPILYVAQRFEPGA